MPETSSRACSGPAICQAEARPARRLPLPALGRLVVCCRPTPLVPRRGACPPTPPRPHLFGPPAARPGPRSCRSAGVQSDGRCEGLWASATRAHLLFQRALKLLGHLLQLLDGGLERAQCLANVLGNLQQQQPGPCMSGFSPHHAQDDRARQSLHTAEASTHLCKPLGPEDEEAHHRNDEGLWRADSQEGGLHHRPAQLLSRVSGAQTRTARQVQATHSSDRPVPLRGCPLQQRTAGLGFATAPAQLGAQSGAARPITPRQLADRREPTAATASVRIRCRLGDAAAHRRQGPHPLLRCCKSYTMRAASRAGALYRARQRPGEGARL